MKTLRRTLAMILCIAMVLTTFGAVTVSAANYADTSGHWAEGVIDKWSGYGVIQGDGGYFRPDDAITRAEVAQVTQNVIGYATKENNTFSDVDPNAWYADAVLRLAAAGTLTGNGDGTMAPNAYMTREEAMTMLGRAYGLTPVNTTAGITQYADYQSVSDYATGYIGAMTAAGYVNGYPDGTIQPQATIARGEFVKILDNMIKMYITAPGTYGPSYAGGIVMVKTGGVVLNGVVANKVVISPQVSGDVSTTGSQINEGVLNLSGTATVNSSTNNGSSLNGALGLGYPGYGGGSYGGSSNMSNTYYTVNFYVDGEFWTGVNVRYNTLVDLPGEPQREGYKFVGWYSTQADANTAGRNGLIDLTTRRITRNLDVYAGFVKDGETAATPEPIGDQTFDPSDSKDVEVNLPEAVKEVKQVTVGGSVVSAESYKVENGKITFTQDFLKSLPEGKNEIVIEDSDGRTYTITITVEGNAEATPGPEATDEPVQNYHKATLNVSGGTGTLESDGIKPAEAKAADFTPIDNTYLQYLSEEYDEEGNTIYGFKLTTANEGGADKNGEVSVTEAFGNENMMFYHINGTSPKISPSSDVSKLLMRAGTIDEFEGGLNNVLAVQVPYNCDIKIVAGKSGGTAGVTDTMTLSIQTGLKDPKNKVMYTYEAGRNSVVELLDLYQANAGDIVYFWFEGVSTGVMQSLTFIKRDDGATPDPNATATPVPEVTATPAPEATATPAPEATATPVPEATATPAPAATNTPAPEATEEPAPANVYEILEGSEVTINTKPDVEGSTASIEILGADGTPINLAVVDGKFTMPEHDITVNVKYEAPAVETATPAPEATATPEAEATATPEAEATATPEAEATATPEAEATATPEAEATATPEAEATATPEVTATPGPTAVPTLPPRPTVQPGPTANPENIITVDGSKETNADEKTFKTVNEAIAFAKSMNSHASADDRIVINVVPNTYREQIMIDVNYLTIQKAPDTEGDVLFTWYYGIGYQYYSTGSNGYYDKNAYETNKAAGTVADRGVDRWGCATRLTANNFIAKDIIFENSFNRYITEEEIEDGVKPAPVGGVYSDTGGKPERKADSVVYGRDFTERAAAIAIEDTCDKTEFYNCQFLSSQDTVYSGSKDNRVYFKNCTIEGQTDYMFGGNTLVFDDCDFNWAGYGTGSAGGHVTAVKNATTEKGYLLYGGRVGIGTLGGTFVPGDFGRPWGGNDSPTAAIGVKVQNLPDGKPSIMDTGWSNWSTVAKESKYYEYGTLDANNTPIDLASKNRNVALPDVWEALVFNPYAYLVREGDDWDPMNVKPVWEPVIADMEALTIPESDTLKLGENGVYTVSGNFKLPDAYEGKDQYDVRFTSNNENYLKIDENGNVAVTRPVEGTIETTINAYIKLKNSPMAGPVGASRVINVSITADPNIDPAPFNEAMAKAKAVIDAAYADKNDYGVTLLDRQAPIPVVEDIDGVKTTVKAEFSGFIKDDGTIIRNAFASEASNGTVKYTIECVKDGALVREEIAYDVSIPYKKADIYYDDFEGGYTTMGGSVIDDPEGVSGKAVQGEISAAFDVTPAEGDEVKVSYKVYGTSAGNATIKNTEGADYLAIAPTGLVEGWNTIEVTIAADKTATISVNGGEPVSAGTAGEGVMSSISFVSGTYDDIAISDHTDVTKAYTTFWRANAGEVGTPKDTYLMRGLTIMYSPDKKGAGGETGGVKFDCGLSSNSVNGRWPAQDGANQIKFIAPADGQWTVYAIPGSGKTFNVGSEGDPKTQQGENKPVDVTVDVVKGETYYASVVGSKGNFLGAKFVPTTEGSEAEQNYITSKWTFQTKEGYPKGDDNLQYTVNAGEKWDYVVKNSVGGNSTMTIEATTGKWGGRDQVDWIGVDAEVKLTVPVVNGSKITVGDTYYGTETYTINGKEFVSEKTPKTYTYYGLDKTVDIVITNGGFFRDVTVVSPEHPSEEIPTPEPEKEIAIKVNGLDEADASAVKIIGKLDGVGKALDVANGEAKVTLAASGKYEVSGVYGGASAYTIPADITVTYDSEDVAVDASKVVPNVNGGTKTYQFGDGSQVPTVVVNWTQFVTQDGLVKFENMRYHNDHGVTNAATGPLVITIKVPAGASTISFGGCAYASDTTMITAENESVTPQSASQKTTSDNSPIDFKYEGEATDLVFSIDGGSIYLHNIKVVSPEVIDPDATATPTKAPVTSNEYEIWLNDAANYADTNPTQDVTKLSDAVIADMAEKGIAFNDETVWHDSQHGPHKITTISIDAISPLRITLGDCQYGAATAQVFAGDQEVDSAALKTGCYDKNKQGPVAVLYYPGPDAGSVEVRLSGGDGYVPYFKVENITVEDIPKEGAVINGTITGLDDADKSVVKIGGKVNGAARVYDVTEGAFTINDLLEGETFEVTGVYGGASAYSIADLPTLGADNATPEIAVTKVVPAPVKGIKKYNFGDGTINPQLGSVSWDNFVTPDGLLTIRNVKFQSAQHGYQDTNGTVTIDVMVPEGNTTVSFVGCAYAGDNVTITPVEGSTGITPESGNLKTADDGEKIDFTYSGAATTLKFQINKNNGAIYLHGVEVTTN